MPRLRATLRPKGDRDVIPGEFGVDATFTNVSAEPVRLNLSQVAHPALALDLRDGAGKPVLLAPPSAPDERDLGPGEPIAPGQSVTVQYQGFLDRSLEAGTYRVRYFSPYPELGGTREDPLRSEWVEFTVRPMKGFTPGKALDIDEPPGRPRLGWWEGFAELVGLVRFWRWIERLIDLIFGRWRRCLRVLSQEVDQARNETISNAPPGAEAWNGNYGWRARFLVTADEANCRVTVAVRVRLNGNITNAQRNAWEQAIENVWGNRFKLCCNCQCCPDGYTVVADIQFVASGEHQVVNVGNSTTNMGNWGAADTVDINHEFGHMLGALDEYFTVNGVNYGLGRQPGGNIMNNPANGPVANHYDLVRTSAQGLLGCNCNTKALAERC